MSYICTYTAPYEGERWPPWKAKRLPAVLKCCEDFLEWHAFTVSKHQWGVDARVILPFVDEKIEMK